MTRGVGRLCFSVLALGLLMPAVVQARMDNLEPPMAYGRVPDNLYAVRPPNVFTHDMGALNLQITNVGMIGNYLLNDKFSAGWRGGEYLWASGLWIGAIGDDSEPHVSTAIPFELRPDLDPLWTIYESYEGIKGGTRLTGENADQADDDGDGELDEDFHDGFDNDNDGAIDEDFGAVSSQMFSCVYRDDTPEALAQQTDHKPLNLTIQQQSFQWGTEQLGEFVGFNFVVNNTGNQRLKEVYLAFFSDSDAGPKDPGVQYWTDDLVGWASIDTVVNDPDDPGPCGQENLKIDAAFMWDVPDDGGAIAGGDVSGVFGALFLGHTTDDTGTLAPKEVGLHTVAWFSSQGEETDPRDDQERYALLKRGTKPSIWARRPEDYRYVISAGPFKSLNPGESLEFQVGYVIGEGHSGFVRNAVNAQRVFNGIFVNADSDPETGVDGKERCLATLIPGAPISWQPCDSLETPIEHRGTECLYVDGDCDPCTGVEGRETRINWVGTTPPPSPFTNIDPEFTEQYIENPEFRASASVLNGEAILPGGDKSIIVQWDNSSELVKDAITRQRLFEGYRIYRADRWDRPEGSLGPAQEDWQLVATFRKSPRDGLGTGSLEHLQAAVNERVQLEGTTPEPENLPIYPIGYYQWQDTSGIHNGKVYFYSVVAFGKIPGEDALGQEILLEGQPTASEAQMVIPRWDAQSLSEGFSCDNVFVVPNPYRGSASWDLGKSDTDPTGTKIAIRGLPEAISTVRIYTLAGDLVLSETHDGTYGNGTFFWNLVTRNGQNAVSGVYVYTVQYPDGVCRGRFVVIR